jgi:dTDP-4-dehydrorhamnose reductase
MIWLVGAKGMLGAEVEALLHRTGARYAATDRETDITDPDVPGAFLKKQGLSRLDWIVNCAAYTAVDRAEDEPEKAFTLNAEGPRNLAKTARDTGASLIQISTDYVFNGEKEGDYLEDDPPAPMSVYGKSKLEGEKAVREELKKHVILRTAWLYGPNGKNFVDTMLRLFGEKKLVTVVDDQKGNPTYARDLAEAVAAIITGNRGKYGTYHFTNEGCVSWFDFAHAIHDASIPLGLADPGVDIKPITTQEFPTKAARPKNSCLSKNRIGRELGIVPRGWREALQSYLEEKAGRS